MTGTSSSLLARAKAAERAWRKSIPVQTSKSVPAPLDREVAGGKVRIRHRSWSQEEAAHRRVAKLARQGRAPAL